MEGEECYKRPDFEQYYQLELYWETRVLHLFMKNFLAANRLVLVLYYLSSLAPTAKHHVKTCQNNLHNDEIQSLVADQVENGSPHVL